MAQKEPEPLLEKKKKKTRGGSRDRRCHRPRRRVKNRASRIERRRGGGRGSDSSVGELHQGLIISSPHEGRHQALSILTPGGASRRWLFYSANNSSDPEVFRHPSPPPYHIPKEAVWGSHTQSHFDNSELQKMEVEKKDFFSFGSFYRPVFFGEFFFPRLFLQTTRFGTNQNNLNSRSNEVDTWAKLRGL